MRHCFLFICIMGLLCPVLSQNLVVDGTISNNANWNSQEAPYNSGTYETSYISGGCGSNYVMEVDAGSTPSQVVNGFVSGMQYKLSFRYAWRTVSCSASNNPTTLNIQFSDAPGVLTVTLSVASTQTAFVNTSFTFTNNTATSHTLSLTNPGNVNTCGVIMDDICIVPVTSPGGVGATNLSLWINAGILGMTDNTGVYGWITGGSNVASLTPPCANPPVYHTGQASVANALVANYNPYVTFNGSSQYLQYLGNRLNVSDVSASGMTSVFSTFMGGGTGQTVFGNRSVNNSILTGRTSDFTMNNNGATGTGNVASYTNSSRVNITSFRGNSNGIGVGDKNGNSSATSNGTFNSDYLTLGANLNSSGTYSQYFGGSLAELIVFNSSLNHTQMHQVRSYMGAKYGVTLADNISTPSVDERNYIASDGSTNYWTYASNATYHNNVSVVGRDDNTSLFQQRSISTDADALSHTGNAMLMIDNGGAFTADKSFFATGHNGISSYNVLLTDVPAGIQTRLQRIWKFQKTGTGVANSVTVKFDMTGYTPLTGSDLRLLVSTSSLFASSTVISGSYSAPYFTASLPTTGGVYYTIGSINNVQTPLPVELLSFAAIAENNKRVKLHWATATEINNAFFTIERSSDAIHFSALTTVLSKALNGNSSTQLDYSTYDEKPLQNQVSYYRLRQTGMSGQVKYYNIVPVDMAGPQMDPAIYPNPNKGGFFVDVTGADRHAVIRVTVLDEWGREHYANTFYRENEGDAIRINTDSKLSAGTYFCQIEAGELRKVITVIVE